MCIFVTIFEKRGIVYTEHMAAVAAAAAAAAMEAKGSAAPRTWVDVGQSGSWHRSTVCVLGTCKAAHVKIQTPSKGGWVMKAAKNRSMPVSSVFIELRWAVQTNREEARVSVIHQSYSRPFGCQHIPLWRVTLTAQMCVWRTWVILCEMHFSHVTSYQSPVTISRVCQQFALHWLATHTSMFHLTPLSGTCQVPGVIHTYYLSLMTSPQGQGCTEFIQPISFMPRALFFFFEYELLPLEMHPHLHLITLGPNIMEGLVIPSEINVKVHLVVFTRPLKHITRSSPVVYADLFELTLNSFSPKNVSKWASPTSNTSTFVNVAPVLREKRKKILLYSPVKEPVSCRL